jgi:hypothetical protein
MQVMVLAHPQSKELLPHKPCSHASMLRIACGTSKVENADLSEANDFYPTYASWNSALFETSVILTVWEHADALVGAEPVAFLHTDVTPHFEMDQIWQFAHQQIAAGRVLGLTVPTTQLGMWDDNWTIPDEVPITPKHDPMLLVEFDYGVHVWDYIKRYDPDIYEWAMDEQPRLIYSHQFACSRAAFDVVGAKLFAVVQRLRLQDVGFWTPHMTERLLALYLARFGGEPLLTTCFWHHASSVAGGAGDLNLYGPRPRRHYKMGSRWTTRMMAAGMKNVP